MLETSLCKKIATHCVVSATHCIVSATHCVVSATHCVVSATFTLSPSSYINSVHFLYWALTMITISAALIIAATQRDPEVYTEPVDVFRGLCEGLAILLVTASALTEIYHIYVYVY